MRLFPTRRKLAEAEATIRRLQAERRACLHLLTDATTRIDLLEAENTALGSQNTALQAQGAQVVATNAVLARTNSGLERHITTMREAHEGMARQNRSLLADVEASIAIIRDHEDTIAGFPTPLPVPELPETPDPTAEPAHHVPEPALARAGTARAATTGDTDG